MMRLNAAALATFLIFLGGESFGQSIPPGDVNNVASIAGVQNVGPLARYNATLPTLTDTRFNLFQVGSRGGLHVDLYGADSATAIGAAANNADAVGVITGLGTAGFLFGYNGATWDRLQVDTSKSLKVAVPAVATGGYSFLNIAAGIATTVVKASAGTLHTITLNSAATATNVTTVYDHPSGVGTVIAIPAVTTATVPTTLLFDLAFANGLTIITATANGGNMTVTFK